MKPYQKRIGREIKSDEKNNHSKAVELLITQKQQRKIKVDSHTHPLGINESHISQQEPFISHQTSNYERITQLNTINLHSNTPIQHNGRNISSYIDKYSEKQLKLDGNSAQKNDTQSSQNGMNQSFNQMQQQQHSNDPKHCQNLQISHQKQQNQKAQLLDEQIKSQPTQYAHQVQSKHSNEHSQQCSVQQNQLHSNEHNSQPIIQPSFSYTKSQQKLQNSSGSGGSTAASMTTNINLTNLISNINQLNNQNQNITPKMNASQNTNSISIRTHSQGKDSQGCHVSASQKKLHQLLEGKGTNMSRKSPQRVTFTDMSGGTVDSSFTQKSYHPRQNQQQQLNPKSHLKSNTMGNSIYNSFAHASHNLQDISPLRKTRQSLEMKINSINSCNSSNHKQLLTEGNISNMTAKTIQINQGNISSSHPYNNNLQYYPNRTPNSQSTNIYKSNQMKERQGLQIGNSHVQNSLVVESNRNSGSTSKQKQNCYHLGSFNSSNTHSGLANRNGLTITPNIIVGAMRGDNCNKQQPSSITSNIHSNYHPLNTLLTSQNLNSGGTGNTAQVLIQQVKEKIQQSRHKSKQISYSITTQNTSQNGRQGMHQNSFNAPSLTMQDVNNSSTTSAMTTHNTQSVKASASSVLSSNHHKNSKSMTINKNQLIPQFSLSSPLNTNNNVQNTSLKEQSMTDYSFLNHNLQGFHRDLNSSSPSIHNSKKNKLENHSIYKLENNSIHKLENNSIHKLENNSIHKLENNSIHKLENNSKLDHNNSLKQDPSNTSTHHEKSQLQQRSNTSAVQRRCQNISKPNTSYINRSNTPTNNQIKIENSLIDDHSEYFKQNYTQPALMKTSPLLNQKRPESYEQYSDMLQRFVEKNEFNQYSRQEYFENLLHFLNELKGTRSYESLSNDNNQNHKGDSSHEVIDKMRYILEKPISSLLAEMRESQHNIQEIQASHQKELEIERAEKKVLQNKLEILQQHYNNNSQNNSHSHTRIHINDMNNVEFEQVVAELEKWRNIAKKQKKSLSAHRIKEEKLMKLLYEVRKFGINVDQIYNSSIKSPEQLLSPNPTHFSLFQSQQSTHEMDKLHQLIQRNTKNLDKQQQQPFYLNSQNDDDLYTPDYLQDESEQSECETISQDDNKKAHYHTYKNQNYLNLPEEDKGFTNLPQFYITPNTQQQQSILNFSKSNIPKNTLPDNDRNHAKEEDIYEKSVSDSESDMMSIAINDLPQMSNQNKAINVEMKDKLKINLGQLHIKDISNQQHILPGTNEHQGQIEEIYGYHDEFMNRFNEFSQSWRDAIIAEKRYQTDSSPISHIFVQAL